MTRTIIATLFTLAFVGCGGGSETSATAPNISTSPDTQATVPTEGERPSPPSSVTVPGVTDGTPPDSSAPIDIEDLPEGAADVVAMAVDDLAARLDLDPATIAVLLHESVTWSDGSIGCPQPGMAYTQGLVPGTRTVLAVDGSQYSYHASRDGDPFFCDRPVLPTGDPTNPDA